MSLAKKIAYSTGNFGINLYWQSFVMYVVFFYVDHLRASAALISLAMGIHGVINAVLNPLVGHISDRTRTKWGRRLPYIAGGAVPFALAFVLIWTPFVHGANASWNLFWYFLFSVLFFDIMFVFVVLNWTALFPEMYPTLKERSSVSAWRQAIGILGMILGVAFPPLLYSTLGWGKMAVIFGAVGLATIAISIFGIRERKEVPTDEANVAILRALKLTFVNRSFVPYVLTSFFVQFPFALIPAVMPFFTKYVLGVDSAETSLLLGTIFVVAFPMVYVWGAVTRRIGARTAGFAAIVLLGFSLVPFQFVRTFDGAWITMAFVGVALAGSMVLLDVLISDVIDEDEMKCAARREGMYYGVQGFIIRFGVTLQAIILGQVLTHTGYVPGKLNQNPAALAGFHDMMALIPILSLVVALAALVWYPLHGERLRTIVRFRAERDRDLAARADAAAGMGTGV